MNFADLSTTIQKVMGSKDVGAGLLYSQHNGLALFRQRNVNPRDTAICDTTCVVDR